METSLQIMKRLRSSSPESHYYGSRSYSIDSSPNQSPNRPDSPEHMGVLSPASSPPHRVFKRRRRESRSPIRSSPDPSGDESGFGGQGLGEENEMSPGSTDDSVFKPLLNTIPKKVTPRTTTPEESSLVMIQRFMTSQTLEIHRLAMKQLCTVKAITGCIQYFRAGANLTWCFSQIINRILEYPSHFNELITCSFPAMVAEAVEARKQIIPEALDQTELQVAPVIAKWLRCVFLMRIDIRPLIGCLTPSAQERHLD